MPMVRVFDPVDGRGVRATLFTGSTEASAPRIQQPTDAGSTRPAGESVRSRCLTRTAIRADATESRGVPIRSGLWPSIAKASASARSTGNSRG